MKISTIETRLSTRYEEHDPEQDGNKNTKFADIIIDGRSFYQRMKKTMIWFPVWDGAVMTIRNCCSIIFCLEHRMNSCMTAIPFSYVLGVGMRNVDIFQ